MSPVPGERPFRALLRLYPPDFRRRYGEAMVDFYRDRRRHLAPGLRPLLRLWSRLVADAITSAAREHARSAALPFRQAPDHRRKDATVSALIHDVRLAARGLLRTPGFALVVIATLALGIGANTAIFSVLDAVLLRPLPYRHADRVQLLRNAGADGQRIAVAGPEFFDYREQLTTFDEVAAFRPQVVTILGPEGEPDRASGYLVTPNLFELLGAAPVLGRGFAADDGAPGGGGTAVLAHAFWVRRFGGDSGVVGREISVGGANWTVIGVMPPGVRFPDAPLGFAREQADLWLAANLEPLRADGRGNQILAIVGRVRPGVDPRQAGADLDRVAEGFRTTWPARYGEPGSKQWWIDRTPLTEAMVGAVRPAVLVLTAVVGLVLLIACANVTNLLLARGSARRREVAVRLALGAGRGGLVRQFVTESLLLSLAGGVLGVGLAALGTPALVALAGGNVPRLDGVRLSPLVLGFAFAVATLTGLVVGAIPAFRQSRTALASAITDGARTVGDSPVRRRFRAGLVAAQMAMALVVLVGAGLLGRSLMAVLAVDPGFSAKGVLTAQLTLPRAQYDSAARVSGFWRRLGDELAAAPGVEAAAVIYPLPMSGESWSGSFDVEGREGDAHAEFAVAGPGYFRTMGIQVLEGREFGAEDRRAAPAAAVVDERLARLLWPGASAVGKRLSTNEADGWRTVVGVVRHVHSRRRDDAGEPQLYFPLEQRPQRQMFAVVRAAGGEAAAALTALRSAIRTLDPALPTTSLRTLEDLAARTLAPQRFNAVLIAVFAAVALGLAAVGLYGVMSFWVAQRTREIGIRMALGGRAADVRRMVVGEGLRISLAGLAVGLLAAAAAARLIAGLLFGVAPFDPVTFGAVAVLLLVVAAGAAWIPARRATSVDPTEALRD